MKLHSCLYHALIYLLDGYQMTDRTDHTANLGRIVVNHRAVQFPQPERSDRSLLRFLSMDGTSYLSNL